MCLFSTPKAPPPPPRPPQPESREQGEMNERRRLVRRQGPFYSPFALADSGFGNPTPQKTLLGG